MYICSIFVFIIIFIINFAAADEITVSDHSHCLYFIREDKIVISRFPLTHYALMEHEHVVIFRRG